MRAEDVAGNILIVDDQDKNRKLLNRILTSVGLVVSEAGSGEQALDLVAKTPPDLILLDIMMPKMDGFEVCRRLKADSKTRHLPVIFITALTDSETELKGFEVGAVDFVSKPFKSKIVLARVDTHLALKKASEKLAEHNALLRENIQLRDDVERMVQHDLKSPLNVILSAPKLLIKDTKSKALSSSQVEMLQMVEEAGFRMLHIINRSLDLYKMEKGTYQLSPVSINILEILNQIHGETRELVRSKNLSVQVVVRGDKLKDSDIFMVSGEEMLCHSLLANLIKNAVEASPENGTVTIYLDDRQRTQITIHNHGIIPESIRGHFFEKYITAGKDQGTGLGTYTAKLIAETLGGGVDFKTSAEDGTFLQIVLPQQEYADPSSLYASSTPTTASVMKGLRVLVVDDYAPMRQTIKGILNQAGISDIIGAKDGAEALQVLDNDHVDLIISDLNMPRVNGFELLRNIRSNPYWRDLPFILVTGDATPETVLGAVTTKVSGFIIKPFVADILVKKIENVLGFRLLTKTTQQSFVVQ